MHDSRQRTHCDDDPGSASVVEGVDPDTQGDLPDDDSPRRIAVMLPHATHWANQMMRGVAAFARRKKNWSVQWLGPQPEALEFLATWRPHGILASLDCEHGLDDLARFRVPIVDVQGAIGRPDLLSVSVDHCAIGRMAADHFSRRGLSNYACLKRQDDPRDRLRCEGFFEFVRLHKGFQALAYRCEGNAERPALLTQTDTRFRDWLVSVPKPLGLFAVNDWLGIDACQICRQLGLRVPLDVAIVGADDDETICQIADPMLSSVNSPLPQVGFDAAKMLAAILGHRPAHVANKLLRPIGVTIRHSCDVCAVADPEIAQVLRLIYGVSSKPLGMKDVLKRIAISRRALEQRFRLATGRSPMAEVRRVSMERAARMLSETDTLIVEIARDCGFGSATHFSVAFSKHHGTSPRRFRLENQAGGVLEDTGRAANRPRGKRSGRQLRKATGADSQEA